MSRKDYVQIATVLKGAYNKTKDTDLEPEVRQLSDELAVVLKGDNSRFSFDIWNKFIFQEDK
jgi:hypothetical protein